MNTHHPEVATAAAALSEHLLTAFKTLKALRPELPTSVRGLDHAAIPLLFALEHGEHRVSSLADACHADLSSTSRNATTLTRLGLVEKSPDPQDRRAQVLALTDAGRSAVADFRALRGTLFVEILSDWGADDVRRFDDYLTRFAADVERHLAPDLTRTKED